MSREGCLSDSTVKGLWKSEKSSQCEKPPRSFPSCLFTQVFCFPNRANRTLVLEFFFSQQRFTHDLGALVCPICTCAQDMDDDNEARLENRVYPSWTRGTMHGGSVYLATLGDVRTETHLKGRCLEPFPTPVVLVIFAINCCDGDGESSC